MQKSPVNKMLLRFVILVLLGFCSVVIKINHNNLGTKPSATNATHDFTDLNRINKAFDNKESNVQVRQTGKILKILRDDDHSPIIIPFLARTCQVCEPILTTPTVSLRLVEE